MEILRLSEFIIAATSFTIFTLSASIFDFSFSVFSGTKKLNNDFFFSESGFCADSPIFMVIKLLLP